MKFFDLKQKIKTNKLLLVRLYFVVGGSILLMLFIMYSNLIIIEAQKEAKTIPDLFSHYVHFTTQPDYQNKLFEYIQEKVVSKIEHPIILTDADKRPTFWKNTGLPEGIPFEALTKPEQKKLLKKLRGMISSNFEIPLKYNDNILGYTYYSESKTMRLLKIMPYVELVIVLLFLSFGIIGVLFLKKSERDNIWVGLAKETAHQFGTPITSLLGWISVIKLEIENSSQKQSLTPMLDCMETDIERLNKVASRFGKVGAKNKRKEVDIAQLIQESVKYFQSRLPNLSKQIKLEFNCNNVRSKLKLDEELIGWAIENVLKNSIDSMKDKAGNIKVELFEKNKVIDITISDEGCGMPKKMHKRIFEPGTTTKTRGWGLGLSLAKRIIEDYHKGKIYVAKSAVGKGTIIKICLAKTSAYLKPSENNS